MIGENNIHVHLGHMNIDVLTQSIFNKVSLFVGVLL